MHHWCNPDEILKKTSKRKLSANLMAGLFQVLLLAVLGTLQLGDLVKAGLILVCVKLEGVAKRL